MALDKTALESLRLERDPDEGKYRQRRGAQRFRLRGGAPAGHGQFQGSSAA
jgi:hypothetical protein